MIFGLAHVTHVSKVALPARYSNVWGAFGGTTLRVTLFAWMGLFILWLISLATRKTKISSLVTDQVERDLGRMAKDRQASGYDYDPPMHQGTPDFAWIHNTAAIATVVQTVVLAFAIILPSWLFGVIWAGTALHLCLLAMLIAQLAGYAIYRRRSGKAWFALVFMTLMIGAFFYALGPKHKVRGLTSINDRKSLQSALRDTEARIQKTIDAENAKIKVADQTGSGTSKDDAKVSAEESRSACCHQCKWWRYSCASLGVGDTVRPRPHAPWVQ